MASNVPRKRKQDLTHTRVEKCARVEENDSQEVFCVDSDCEVDEGDCVVVSEKIIIKRGRCQNPACLSPEGTKLQKASRRVQDFYGHSCKKGRIWRICDICYTKAEEHLGKLKNNFINRVPIVGSQFPFYGEMVALEEEDSTDDDEEEPLDDTVAEFMSNCASDMINTIFEKYDINFQVEEGVKKLLEGYEKVESEIEAQIKSCEEIASSFSSSCDDFYKENEYYREELPAVEIDCGPEEVTIDDNSDGDDVIVVESVRSLQNMPEEFSDNTSLTQSQPNPICPNQSSVTEQTSGTRTILPEVSHTTATNHQIFGELRTIVKLSGGNSGSSSKGTGVVNGCIPEKRNCDKQSAPVHASGAGGMPRDSNTKASRKDSSAQKQQTFTEGGVTESAPIHCVPLQQLLQQGLSVLDAQPGNTSVREAQAHKEQQSSSQVSEHTNVLLHKHLQQRFSVLSPSTDTASTQDKHQLKAHQLRGYTTPVSQQNQVIGNVPSIQRQQQHDNQIPHSAVNQQSRHQISQTSQQSRGHYMPQPSQHSNEQHSHQVPPQPTTYTSPKPNVQHTPQNSTQLMSQSSLPQSGQHVTSRAEDSIARNTYLTSKQSIQQTTAQPGRQSLACAQPQPSGYVSQPVQQPTGYVSQPVQKPTGYVSQPVQQPTGYISQPVQQPSGSISQPVQQPSGYIAQPVQEPSGSIYQPVQQSSGYLSQPVQQPSGYLSQPVQQPSGYLSQPVQQPTGYVSQPVQQPTGYVSQPVQQPTGYVSQTVQQPTGYVSQPVQQPTGYISQPVQQPSGSISQPVQQSTGYVSQPVQQPTGYVSQPVQQPTGYVSQPVQQPTGYVSKPVQQPTGHVSKPVQQSTGHVSKPVQQATGHGSKPVQQSTGHGSKPVQQSTGHGSKPVQQSTGHVSKPVLQSTGHVSKPVQQATGHGSKPVQQATGHGSKPVQQATGHGSKPVQQATGHGSKPVQQATGHGSKPVQQHSGNCIPQSLQQSSGKSESNHSQSVVQLQVQPENKLNALPQQQSSGQYFYQPSQQPSGHNVTQVPQQLNNRDVSQPSKEQTSSEAITTQKPNFVNTTTASQTCSATTTLKTPPAVQSTLTEQIATQHNLRMTDSMVHQNKQKRLNLATGQVSHQSKVLPTRETGSLVQQNQTGQNVPQSPQHPAGQALLVVPQQNVQPTPKQHAAQKPLQSANRVNVQSESQKPIQSSVKCESHSPQLTNRVTQHSHENNASRSPIQPSVENMSNSLIQQSSHFPPQVVHNSSVTSLPSSSEPNIPGLNQTPQQDIRRTVQIVSKAQLTRQCSLTEPQNRQNVTVNQDKKNEECVAKTHQQLNGLRNMASTFQKSGQDAEKKSEIFKSQLGHQCPQKQNVPAVSQSPQQSGKQMVSQVPHQYSGQNVSLISATCNKQQTLQSVQDLCALNSLKLQQQLLQKQQSTSLVVVTGDITNRTDTKSNLPNLSESSVPRNPLISSNIVQNPHMESEPLKKQGQVVSELGIKQQQQKQYTPSSSSQESQQHASLTKYDTGSHQAYSKTQAQDPKNLLQLSEERTQHSPNNGVLLQNVSQALQHLPNKQSEKTELKVQPVIPLQKSESSDQGRHPQHSNQQMFSSMTVSQVVPQQLHSSSTNLQIPANVSQQSVVSQFPGNLFVMLQQQQVTMMLGMVFDILSRFLPMVTQQQCQKDSTQVAVASSSVNTSSSQQQTSKVIPNKDDLRLPEKDGNEISDTESMCHSPVDSSTSFSTPTKSVLCTSPSTLSSSTDSDISVSDSIEVCAEKDVVTVGKIVIKESNLPPLGLVNRPPVIVGDSMYIMNDIKRPWILAKVRDIVTQNNQTLYTVEFTNFKNKQIKETRKVAGFQLAYSGVQHFRFSVGHRIISIFRDEISNEDYYSGVIAEPPKSINRYRYLVFFDNGGSQYVEHHDIRLVVESSPSVWEDVHIEIREFVQNYLEKYPERALLKVQEGQEVRTEWNRRWYSAKVLKVDASLARMSFPSNGKHVEWIYRGSARFYPLFEAQNRVSKEQFARSKAFARKKGDPYIQYTLKEEEELDKEMKEEPEAATEESEPSYRSTARKSTSQLTAQYPRLSSTVKAPKRIFYPCYSQVTYRTHRCKPSCVIDGSPENDYTNYRNLLSHLSEPMLHGWTREKVKHSEYVSVYYRAPCKRRLRNIEELHRYLLITKSKLTVDQFDFDHWVRCFTEGINEKYFVKIEDISNGVEAVPIPCINTVDSRKPEEITYVTKHVPTNGTYIETDPEFLICCDCIDDCSDKEKCACWRQTMEGVKYSPESESPNHEGYYYKRLYEPLVTGIYECNSRCKCSSTCLNRLVQLPMKCKVQVFMTPNRGWGIRALHDIPKGSFICLYAGHVLSEKVGDALAKEVGDEYQADLDYIESAEKVKEDYEENPYENELEEDCGKKQNTKQKGQTTASKKSASKQPKIVSPSTRVLFGRKGRYILDAKTCGNVGRFINHSCNANLFAQNVFVDTHDLRFPWVAFFTNSFVPANTELTWNYGYDVDSVPERVIICKCGEANCQGRLL